MRLHDFTALTLDCYGTLIDWESGLYSALQPLLEAGSVSVTRDAALTEFGRLESAQQQATPGVLYPQLLAAVHRQLASHWSVRMPEDAHRAFGESVPRWPAFPDTTAALQYLQRHYKLVILSNVDRASFVASNRLLGVSFDTICTAQDIGSYKPDPRNFQYLIGAVGRLGIAPAHILHTAQSLYHDHAPARAAGLATAWIDRRHEIEGWGATRAPESTPGYDFRFTSLAQMVQAHQAENLT